MSAPLIVPVLPDIPGLPVELLVLAAHVITAPLASSDHLLLLADALDEMTDHPRIEPAVAAAARILADDLRQRAPAYA